LENNVVTCSIRYSAALASDAFTSIMETFSGRFTLSANGKLDESGQVDGQLVPVSLLVTQLTHPAYQSGSLPEVS
jgi:hypothetical protein